MSRSNDLVPVETRLQIVLAVMSGEITIAEAARRHGSRRSRSIGGATASSMLALAEATVQLRIWQKGSEYIDQVPSQTSRP